MTQRMAAAIALALVPAWGQSEASLQIQILSGQRAVFAAGVASARPVTVLVKDAAGKPLSGASVTFHLPAEGPSGRFPSGLLTEVLLTGADGKASVFGIHWNDKPGPVAISVAAAKSDVRAIEDVMVEISSTAQPTRDDRQNTAVAVRQPSSRKWVLLGLVAAGAAGASLAAMTASGHSSPAAPAAVQAPPPVQISPPTIVIGRP
jgi:hypothetical protein